MRTLLAATLTAATVVVAAPAVAHVDLAGPGFAGTNQVLTFSVGHGCAADDTYRIEIQIPPAVTSVRPLPSAWGEAQLTRDAAELVTGVAWEKGAARAADDHYYELRIRIRVPDAPFTRLYFPSIQYCRRATGEETTVGWTATPDNPGGEEPAASLWIVPPRHPGWNRYEVPAALSDLSVFDDAQIVWAGQAAYSSNEAVAEMIRNTADVTELSSIPSGASIWVKY